MAGWISSKLKVAETFLQQIDQQAAESLGKSGDGTSSGSPFPDDFPGEFPKRNDPSPSLKHQLPKKPPSPSPSPPPPPLPSDSDVDPRRPRPTTPVPPASNSGPRTAVADGDWTELLSSAPTPTIPVAASKKPLITSVKAIRRGSTGTAKQVKRPGSSTAGDEAANSSSKEEVETVAAGPPVPRRSSSLLDLTKDLLMQEFRGGTDTAESKSGALQEEEARHSVDDSSSVLDKKGQIAAGDDGKGNLSGGSKPHGTVDTVSDSDSRSESDSGTDSASTSDSEERQRRDERRKRREQMRTERMLAIAAEAIKERENTVARLEGEKLSLGKMLAEREKKQAQEATELQTSMIETMEAVEIEKQRHNNTMMEALAQLAKLEVKNAELARSLAVAQGNLKVEVSQLGELRRQIELKELAQEGYRRKISEIHQSTSLDETESLRRSQLEQEILGAEYSLVCDKILKLKDKAKILEENIERTRRETVPTEVELELKKRIDQLTDRLIQIQTQVESLSSEKATLTLRMETVSTLLEETGFSLQTDLKDGTGSSKKIDIESGLWQAPRSALRPTIHEKIKAGQRQLGSVIRQLDSISSAGIIFLRRNQKAQIWALLYLVCLHFWVLYILMSKSQAPNDARSGSVYSLETINKTGS